MADWDMAVVIQLLLLQQAMSILVLVGLLWMFKLLRKAILHRLIIISPATTSTHVLLVMINYCAAGEAATMAN